MWKKVEAYSKILWQFENVLVARFFRFFASIIASLNKTWPKKSEKIALHA